MKINPIRDLSFKKDPNDDNNNNDHHGGNNSKKEKKAKDINNKGLSIFENTLLITIILYNIITHNL